MRKLLLGLLFLAAGLVGLKLSRADRTQPPGTAAGGGAPAPVVFRYLPMGSGVGTHVPDNAATVNHTLFNGYNPVNALLNGTAFADTWTVSGTPSLINGGLPGYVTPSPIAPLGFWGGWRWGAGPFTTTNYYSVGSGSLFYPSTGFMECMAFVPTQADLTSENILLDLVVGTGTGRLVFPFTNGVMDTFYNGAGAASTANAVTVGQLNVTCWGLNNGGTTSFVSLNGGTVGSASVTGSYVTPTGNVQIGGAGSQFFQGSILGYYSTGTAWNATTANNLETYALANAGKFPTGGLWAGQEDANVKSEAFWAASGAISDPYQTWTIHASPGVGVRQVPVALAQGGAGPGSGTNYYFNNAINPGTGGASFTGCVAWEDTGSAVVAGLIGDAVAGLSHGWALYSDASGTGLAYFYAGNGTTSTNISSAVVANQLNAACFGFDGSKIWLDTNGGPVQSLTWALSNTSSQTRLLQDNNGGGNVNQILFDEYLTTTAPTAASLQKLTNQYLLKLGHSPTFATDANTISRATFNGAAISDAYTSWTMQGAVPQVATAFGPYASGATGFVNGPFSYSTGNGADALHFNNDFTVVAIYGEPSLAACYQMIGNADSLQKTGWTVDPCTNNTFFTTGTGASDITQSIPTPSGSSLNVICAGRSGTQDVFVLNNTVAGGGSPAAPGNAGSTASTIGTGPAFPVYWPGTLYEFWASTDTPTTANCQAINEAVLGELGTGGEPLTFTRASSAVDDWSVNGACPTPPCMFTEVAGIPRIEPRGEAIEPSSTNLVTQSQTLSNAAWTSTNATAVADGTDVGPDGTKAFWTTNTSTLAGGFTQSATTVAAAAIYTVSVYARTTSSTQSFQFAIRDTTASTSSCVTTATATTTSQRFSCTLGANATLNDVLAVRILPGGAATGTILDGGVQLEQGTFASQYIPTTTTAVTRAADIATFVPPSTPLFVGMDYSASVNGWMEGLQTAGSLWQVVLGSNQTFLPFFRVESGGAAVFNYYSDTGVNGSAMAIPIPLGPHHYAGARTLANITEYLDTVAGSTVSPSTQPPEPAVFQLGGYGNGGATAYLGGWVNNVCIGRTSGACN